MGILLETLQCGCAGSENRVVLWPSARKSNFREPQEATVRAVRFGAKVVKRGQRALWCDLENRSGAAPTGPTNERRPVDVPIGRLDQIPRRSVAVQNQLLPDLYHRWVLIRTSGGSTVEGCTRLQSPHDFINSPWTRH
jgi:hypothetical protein